MNQLNRQPAEPGPGGPSREVEPSWKVVAGLVGATALGAGSALVLYRWISLLLEGKSRAGTEPLTAIAAVCFVLALVVLARAVQEI